MKSNYIFYDYGTFLNEVLGYINQKWFILMLITLGMSVNGYSQKDKDIIPLFVKVNEGELHIISSYNTDVDVVGKDSKLVYLGKPFDVKR